MTVTMNVEANKEETMIMTMDALNDVCSELGIELNEEEVKVFGINPPPQSVPLKEEILTEDDLNRQEALETMEELYSCFEEHQEERIHAILAEHPYLLSMWYSLIASSSFLGIQKE